MALRQKNVRQRIWKEIRKFGPEEYFTARCIVAVSSLSIKSVRGYLRVLAGTGYIGVINNKAGGANQYRLINDIGVEEPRLRDDGSRARLGRSYEQMWSAMRRLGDFSHSDLAVIASTDEYVVGGSHARNYVKHLYRAGYLSVVIPAKTGQSQARYRLAMNTGPKPPLIRRATTIYDQNTRQTISQPDDEA